MINTAEVVRPTIGQSARIRFDASDPEAQAFAAYLRQIGSSSSRANPQDGNGASPAGDLPSTDAADAQSGSDTPAAVLEAAIPPAESKSADTHLVSPDGIEPTKGSMGFLPLVHPSTGIPEYGPIKRELSRNYTVSCAFLLVPEDSKLNPLLIHRVDQQERAQMSNTERRKQDFEALKHLKGLLGQNGWVMTRGFSYFQRQSAGLGEHAQPEQHYGILLLIKHNDELWELPPRNTPYPIDFPQRLERGEENLPASAIPFMHTQRGFEVQMFQCSRRDPEPGYSWVEINAFHTDYMVFRGKQNGVSEEWVVRKLKLPGETYPKSVERYLKQRFGAELQIEKRRIVAPPEVIPMIIGREDATGDRHLNRITEALGVTYLRVMTPEEAHAADEARKQHFGKGKGRRAHQRADGARPADASEAPLVRTYRSVNDEQRDRWDKKGYAVFVGVDDYWVVKKTPEGIAKYLKQRFGATLDLDKGSIVIDGNKRNLIGQLFGMEHVHRLALKALLKSALGDQDLHIVKTFRG